MNKSPIYRWSGGYFGFVSKGHFFDSNSNHLGWVENDGSVWNADGTYLGELKEGKYILRNTMKMEPMPRMPKMPPIPPIPPVPKIDKIGKIPKMSWEDALNKFK